MQHKKKIVEIVRQVNETFSLHGGPERGDYFFYQCYYFIKIIISILFPRFWILLTISTIYFLQLICLRIKACQDNYKLNVLAGKLSQICFVEKLKSILTISMVRMATYYLANYCSDYSFGATFTGQFSIKISYRIQYQYLPKFQFMLTSADRGQVCRSSYQEVF